MSGSWADGDLGEKPHDPSHTIIHHVKMIRVPSS
jgi:hypothetical protein